MPAQTLKFQLMRAKPILTLIYLSALGFLCLFSAQRYLGLSFDLLNCLTFMGIIFGVYTLNRFTDAEEDFTNDIGRLIFFQQKRIFLYIAVAVLAASVGALVWLEKLNGMHLLLLAMGFAYSYRLVPWYSRKAGLHMIRIKEMTFIKNLAVSFLWSSSVFLVPILYSGISDFDPMMVWLLAGGLFVSTLNNTLFDDIMDEPGDRLAGIKTLPTLWGGSNSALMLMALDTAWLAATAGLWFTHQLGSGHAAFLAFLGLYPFLYMWLYTRKSVSKGLVDFLSESDLFFFAMGLLLLSRG